MFDKCISTCETTGYRLMVKMAEKNITITRLYTIMVLAQLAVSQLGRIGALRFYHAQRFLWDFNEVISATYISLHVNTIPSQSMHYR